MCRIEDSILIDTFEKTNLTRYSFFSPVYVGMRTIRYPDAATMLYVCKCRFPSKHSRGENDTCIEGKAVAERADIKKK